MVYAGYINKNIVALLQSFNCNAIGLCGADGDAILAHKRKHPVMDYGFVGDVDAINTLLLEKLLEQNFTPVFAPLSHDQQGQLLNTNADTIAREIAAAMSSLYETELLYAFEKPGVLMHVSDESSLIRELGRKEYDLLKQSAAKGAGVSSGMIPKLDNAFQAMEKGVKKVIIGMSDHLPELIAGSSGTTIVND
jgi:acetylglutamate kinase